MDILFEKNFNKIIIKLLNSNLTILDIQQFVINIKKNSELINSLIETMKKLPEISQLLLDIHIIYKIDGIIEYLIEIYMNEEDTMLKKFFIFISQSFQIGKHIYDFIFKKIGKLNIKNINEDQKIEFPNEKEIKLFERGIDLLMIFYKQYDNSQFLVKESFLYLNNNKIKIKDIDFDSKQNIHIGLNLYINSYCLNEASIILKIKISKQTNLVIKLLDNINIEIYLNDEKINDELINFKMNFWNFILMEISKDKIYVCINDKITNININETILKINLSFYKQFNGIISLPIIFNEDSTEGSKNNSNNEILFKRNVSSNNLDNKYKNLKHIIFNKTIFPYSFENFFYKENIFLLGGVQNILPLFEIMYNLYEKDDERMINTFSKIIQILELIFSFENNIEDAINSKFFDIFSIIINKLTENNNNFLPQIILLIEKLIINKSHSNDIYLSLKELIFNKNILLNLKINIFLEFILGLKQYQEEIFYYLFFIIVKTKEIKDDFLDKIFYFFYQYLNSESIKKIKKLERKGFFDSIENIEKIDFKKIGEICLLMTEYDIDDKIILKSLNLIIDIFDIKINKKIIENKLVSQQKSILKSLNLYIELTKNQENDYKDNHTQSFVSLMEQKIANLKTVELEIILIRNIGILNYLIKNKLMYFIVKLSYSKNIDIKFKLFNLFQIIFYYYINTCGQLSIDNQSNLLYELERKEMGLTKEEFINKLIQLENLNKNLKLDNLIQKINNNVYNQLKTFPKNNNDNGEFKEITLDFIQLLNINLNLKFDENDENNLSFYLPQILSFIKNFLSLVINNHFFFLESSNFYNIKFIKYVLSKEGMKLKTKVSPIYFDLYRNTSFTNILLPILIHLYIIDKDKNNKEINEIYDYIFEILFEIYLNGIENGPYEFLYFLKKFDEYINIIREEKNIVDFVSFFF